ncbi:uncharacterized protein [Ptychodera flava]|uniref:uncharacterized protein n=1 Tax=Ptychodera flava TaxID=63121 RepID=UPI00396A9535
MMFTFEQQMIKGCTTNISAFETSSSSFYVKWARPANDECIKSYNVRYTSEFYQGETEVTDQYAHITKVPSGAEYTVSLSANIYKGYDITDESEPRLTTVILPDKKRTTIIVPAILVAWMILCLSTLFYCRKHRVMIYEHCFKSIRKKDFREHMDGMLNDRPSVPSYDESFLYDTLNNTSISTSTYHVNASVSVASVTESSLSTTRV